MLNKGAVLFHKAYGVCTIDHVERDDWVARRVSDNVFVTIKKADQPAARILSNPVSTAVSESCQPVKVVARKVSGDSEVQKAKRTIESLGNGLTPTFTDAEHLAVGFSGVRESMERFLNQVGMGGSAMVFRGEYGQGKTFALKALEESAVRAGYVTARTEIDATSNQLSKPHHVYRELMRSLRLPGLEGAGVRTLALATTRLLIPHRGGSADREYQSVNGTRWLEDRKLSCYPLAWLLSDPDVAKKTELLRLLECDRDITAAQGRAAHAWSSSYCWPTFNAGTQGAFASYLLAGVGRLSRLLGHKGFVILLDEMENWQSLNWVEQTRAGNMLGGLIWGATAEEGHRGEHERPRSINHSPRCRGFPVTTEPRCHVGVAIAITPRGTRGPEHLWEEYGPVTITPLPQVTDERLVELTTNIAPYYEKAYRLKPFTSEVLTKIAIDAIARWRHGGKFTIRYGVQAVIAAYDHWMKKR